MLVLREFEALSSVLSVVPHKSQRGLFTSDIVWTCFDACDELFAIGTNTGSLFVYDRSRKMLKHSLSAKQDRHGEIRKVKIVRSIDTVVAAGMVSGAVCIFQLLSVSRGQIEEVRVFLIMDIHQCEVTCLEWSQNAMKLFSGDCNGVIACTEIDYISNSSKSYVVHRESAEARIVQLNYNYRKLLVSSLERSFVVHIDEENKITQIGKSQRKRTGTFGTVFLPGALNAKDAVIYAARPGLRLWKAQTDGTVELTYILQDSICGFSMNIHPLHEIVSDAVTYDQPKVDQFGPLYIFCQSLVLTFHGTSVYVIDPEFNKIICYHSNLGEIVDVAVNKDEVFVLRKSSENDVLIRLSQRPNPIDAAVLKDIQVSEHSSKQDLDINPPQVVIKLGQTAAKMTENIANKVIKEVGEKLQAVPKITPKNIPVWVQSKIIKNDFGRNENQIQGQKLSRRNESLPSIEIMAENVLVDSGSKQTIQGNNQNGSNCNSTEDVESNINASLPNQSSQVSVSQSNSSQEMSDFNDVEGCPVENGFTDTTTSFQVSSHTVQHSKTVAAFPIQHEADHDEIVFSKVKRYTRRRSNLRVKTSADSVSLASADSIDSTSLSFEVPNSSLRASCPDIEIYTGVKETEIEQLTIDATPEAPEAINTDDNVFGINMSLLRDDKPLFDLIAQEAFDNEMSKGDLKADECDLKLDKNETDNSVNCDNLENGRDASESKAAMDCFPTDETDNYSPLSPMTDFMILTNNGDSAYLTNEISIYSKSNSIVSDAEGSEIVSLEDALEHVPSQEPLVETPLRQNSNMSPSFLAASSTLSEVQSLSVATSQRVLMPWREFQIPACLSSIAISASHIWCTDEEQRIHYSSLIGQGLEWRSVTKLSAEQIAVSPSGTIIWHLYSGSAYASTSISHQHPFGINWVEAARDVVHVAVDDGIAWYVKTTGEVGLQKDLSAERPISTPVHVPCSFKMVQISCYNGVVCGITSDNSVVVRRGVTRLNGEGTEWSFIKWNDLDHMISRFDLGENGTAWAIDHLGRLWFSTGFSLRKPEGDGTWWQASLNPFLMSESNFWEAVKAMKLHKQNRLPKNLLRTNAGLISARTNGLWICPPRARSLHFCRGNVVGYRWHEVNSVNVFDHKKWMIVSATGLESGQSGLVWLVDSFGSVFCFVPSISDGVNLISVDPPEPRQMCRSFSASVEVAWCLLDNGHVYIRRQMAGHCLPGYGWDKVDMIQIGWGKLVHVSIGCNSVWGAHSSGAVYLRIGVRHRPKGHTLNPAWLKLDSHYDKDLELVRFKHIFVSPDDSMVWAIDVKNHVYVRIGITETLPIGLGWQLVEGYLAESLCISKSQAYATTPTHDLIKRIGITPDRPEGEFWQVLPGSFKTVSVTAKDELWAIDKDGDLFRQEVHLLKHPSVLENLSEGQLVKSGVGTVDENNWVIY